MLLGKEFWPAYKQNVGPGLGQPAVPGQLAEYGAGGPQLGLPDGGYPGPAGDGLHLAGDGGKSGAAGGPPVGGRGHDRPGGQHLLPHPQPAGEG